MDVTILSVSDRIHDLINQGVVVSFKKEASSGKVLCRAQVLFGEVEGKGDTTHDSLLSVYETIQYQMEGGKPSSFVSRETSGFWVYPSEQYTDEGEGSADKNKP